MIRAAAHRRTMIALALTLVVVATISAAAPAEADDDFFLSPQGVLSIEAGTPATVEDDDPDSHDFRSCPCCMAALRGKPSFPTLPAHAGKPPGHASLIPVSSNYYPKIFHPPIA